jgi:tetratricopeptide (TPR) repeat protein
MAGLRPGCTSLQESVFRSVADLHSCRSECSSAFNNRGISYKQLGKTIQAIEDYRQCLQIDPSDEYARKNLELCEQEEAAKSQSVRGMAVRLARPR